MGLSIKLLAAALSAAATASASCSTSGTTTIRTGGDATAIASCSTYSGNIVIETGAAVSGEVNLDGISEIDGTLTHENSNLTQTFSAKDLEKISGTLTLSNLSQLGSIILYKLTSANNIVFEGLGSLGDLGFIDPDNSSSTGLQTAGDITIDNTKIQDLQGIYNLTKADGFYITDNPYLNEIAFGISSAKSVQIGVNDQDQGVSFSMPNLTSVELLVVQQCASVELPKLQMVANELGLIGNNFKNVSFPELTSSGAMTIIKNENMTTLDFPALTTVNGSNSSLTVAYNNVLSNITGFPKLNEVSGGVNLTGNFSGLTFPKIHKIGGALTVDTASSTFDCSILPKTGSQIVDGSTTCHIGDKTKVGGTSTGTSTTSSSSFAYAHEIPASFMPIFPLIAGLLFA